MKIFKKSFPDWYVSKSGVQSTALLHLVVMYSYYFRMAECAEDVFVNPDLSEKLKEMWNKEEFSDTLFLVNDCQFHVSSHWVSVMSGVLKGVISDHYQHCGDREIQINEVKNNESFSVVLKFIYGFGINLKEMDKELLCDVLYQAERFQLNGLSKKLKSYLSSLDKFDIDSFAVLINTAKNFAIDDLYKKLVIFAYENTDQLVKHESFVDLKYDVLSEMLKADNFFAAEIDILLGALKWHENNFDKNNYDEALKVDNDNESIQASSIESVVTDSLSDALPNDATDEEDINAVKKDNEVEEKGNMSSTNSNVTEKKTSEKIMKGTPSGELNPPNEALCYQLNKFSENVLKSLLSQIRFKLILLCDFQRALNLDVANKYKKFLEKCELFSQTHEPRKKYAPSNESNVTSSQITNRVEVSSVQSVSSTVKLTTNLNIHCEILHDITRKFTVTCPYKYDSSQKYTSAEEYAIGEMKWKLIVNDERYNTHFYLICASDIPGIWNCVIECQIRMLSNNPNKYAVRIFPDGSGFYPFKLAEYSNTSSGTDTCLGSFVNSSAPSGWRANYAPNDKFTFEVHFLYIHKTVKEIKQTL